MPSAEKVTSMAAKPESAQPIEPKPAENTQKDADEKSSSSGQLSSIQQALLIISNKVRNLEKRKVGYTSVLTVIKLGKFLEKRV